MDSCRAIILIVMVPSQPLRMGFVFQVLRPLNARTASKPNSYYGFMNKIIILSAQTVKLGHFHMYRSWNKTLRKLQGR